MFGNIRDLGRLLGDELRQQAQKNRCNSWALPMAKLIRRCFWAGCGSWVCSTGLRSVWGWVATN